MTGNWQEVGRRIRTLREELRWTQQELSERSGVSIATIRSTEHAVGSRTRRTLQDLSMAFGHRTDYLSDILDGRGRAGRSAQ
jgi:transcriptional regulator with XRE-family HTH domain